MYRVSADIGGTFTDIVVEDSSKKNIKTIKVLSTPENKFLPERVLCQ